MSTLLEGENAGDPNAPDVIKVLYCDTLEAGPIEREPELVTIAMQLPSGLTTDWQQSRVQSLCFSTNLEAGMNPLPWAKRQASIILNINKLTWQPAHKLQSVQLGQMSRCTVAKVSVNSVMMPSSCSDLPRRQAQTPVLELKNSISSLKVHMCTSRPRLCAWSTIPRDLFCLQSHSTRSLTPTLQANCATSARLTLAWLPLEYRKLTGRSVVADQNFTVQKSKLWRQIGRRLVQLSTESSLYFRSTERMVAPISQPQSSRYISEDLASMSRPTRRPSGLRAPWCWRLKARPYSMMSQRVGKEKKQSSVVILPGAWSCLMCRVSNSWRVKLSVHQSVTFLPSKTRRCCLSRNSGLLATSVILLRYGSCIISGTIYFVQQMSNSTKSAPMYMAALRLCSVFSGKTAARPRCAMLSGRPSARTQPAPEGLLQAKPANHSIIIATTSSAPNYKTLLVSGHTVKIIILQSGTAPPTSLVHITIAPSVGNCTSEFRTKTQRQAAFSPGQPPTEPVLPLLCAAAVAA